MIAVSLAKAYPNASILAADFSEAMINYVNYRIEKEDLKNVKAEQHNGIDLSALEADSFDYVFCQFGVMFFPDHQRGFDEMYRVLKKGGKAVIVTWKDFGLVAYIDEACKRMGKYQDIHHVAGHPLNLSDEEKLKELATKAGFTDPVVHVFENDMVAEPQTAFYKSLFSNPVTKLHEAEWTDEEKGQLKETINSILKEKWGEGNVVIHGVANYLIVTK